MKLEINPNSKNYAAVVVALKDFVDLPNCDNVKAVLIFGNSIIVSKAAAVGDVGLYFPVETALTKAFLGPNNLYRKPEFGNADPEQKGFFEEHGRVKAVKFRGHASTGFWIPLNSLDAAGFKSSEFELGMEFNSIDGIEICKKYVPRFKRDAGAPGTGKKPKGKQPKVEDQLVDGQFRFHFDTAQLRRNAFAIKPETIVSVSDKWHGTSVICGNLMAKVEHPWLHRTLSKIFKIRLQDSEYAGTAASRRVIKSVGGESRYQCSFWRRWYEAYQASNPSRVKR